MSLNTDRLECVLDMLATSKPRRRLAYSLDLFHGAEPFLKGLLLDDAAEQPLSFFLSGSSDKLSLPTIDIDITLLTNGEDGGFDHRFNICKFKTLSRRAKAKYGIGPNVDAVSHVAASMYGDWTWDHAEGSSSLIVWTRNPGEAWVNEGERRANVGERRRRHVRNTSTAAANNVDITVAHNRMLQRKHDWRVVIAEEGAPGLSFVTDPQGAKEAFKMRELPVKGSRRKALIHWVASHHRKTSREEESIVRAHLRGAQSFRWNGLSVEIYPSVIDAALAEAPGRSIPVNEPGTSR